MKARSTMKDQTKATHAKLTSSVLLSSDCGPVEEISNWRDSLAALNHRSLARQICDQFYDISILAAWRGRSAEIAAAERALSTALPACCQDSAKAEIRVDSDTRPPAKKALILGSVLAEKQPRKTAVLITLRSKAA